MRTIEDDRKKEPREKEIDLGEKEEGNEKKEKKDNKVVAIIAMTIASMTVTGITSMFREIAKDGFHVVDFAFIRNCFSTSTSLVWCLVVGTHPIKDFPHDRK